jgi:hypothetical protein
MTNDPQPPNYPTSGDVPHRSPAREALFPTKTAADGLVCPIMRTPSITVELEEWPQKR